EETGLLSEDGALEVARGGFSIEPFVLADARVASWADVEAQPFLVDNYLPMPGVRWRDPRWELRVTTFATGERARSHLVARYDLINRTAKPLTLTLVLAVRPYQVNPPAQFLNIVGGVSAIRDTPGAAQRCPSMEDPGVFRCVHPAAAGPFPSARAPDPGSAPAAGPLRTASTAA